MDDHDLRTLDHEPLGDGARPRPVEDVLRRGRTLRRRAVAARTAPVLAVVAVAATAGVAALRGGPGPEVATGPDEPELPTKVAFCDSPDAEPVPADQLDGLRLVPGWLPPGIDLVAAAPVRQVTGECAAVDPALVLRAVGDDGTVGAEIVLEGPFGQPYEGEDGITLEPTQLRGGDASRTFDATSPGSSTGFTWTEPDGASWVLTGTGTDDPTLRAVAEALELAGHPPDGDPAAALPEGAIPAGFAVVWQDPGLPEVEGPARLEWHVTTTDPGYPPCGLTIATTDLQAPPGRLFRSGAGTRATVVDVRGHPGFAIEERGMTFLDWDEAPGVAGSLQCPGDVDTALRIAGSLVEVAPDDPLITDR
jgi:hypothetical protein